MRGFAACRDVLSVAYSLDGSRICRDGFVASLLIQGGRAQAIPVGQELVIRAEREARSAHDASESVARADSVEGSVETTLAIVAAFARCSLG